MQALFTLLLFFFIPVVEDSAAVPASSNGVLQEMDITEIPVETNPAYISLF